MSSLNSKVYSKNHNTNTCIHRILNGEPVYWYELVGTSTHRHFRKYIEFSYIELDENDIYRLIEVCREEFIAYMELEML